MNQFKNMKSSLNVGMVCLATDQGLGYLAKSFYDNGLIRKVLIHHHSSRENHYDWYTERCQTEGELLDSGITTLLLFETPFYWPIIQKARAKGIKTVLIPMYECTKFPFPFPPDLVLFPSLLDLLFYRGNGILGQFQQIPVEIPFKLRKQAKVFVHNAGNGGLGGRNGTRELLAAMPFVRSPIKLILRSQVPIEHVYDDRIDLRIGQFEDIWSEGDVFVFPEKFNGLSLPLQEAFAAGMLVMCGARFPMTEWLPKEPLIPISGYHKERISIEFDYAEYDPKDIAACIDKWYDADIEKFSLLGKDFGEKNSWKKLKEKFEILLSA